jgi:hypothetical protein
MVVHNLDVKRVGVNPAEADPPLVVVPNPVLSQPVTGESLKTISRECSTVEQHDRSVDLVQPSLRHRSDPLEPPAEFPLEHPLRLLVP